MIIVSLRYLSLCLLFYLLCVFFVSFSYLVCIAYLQCVCFIFPRTYIHTHSLTHLVPILYDLLLTLRLADATLHSFMLLAVCLVIICSFFSSFFCFPPLVTVYFLLLISDHPRWINHIPFCLVCGW